MNKLANIGMMFLVGVVVTMSGCGKQTTPANSAPLVKTIVIGEEISENKHSFSGTVHGCFEAPLSFQVGGRIVERYVQSGQRVTAGEALFKLDSKDAEEQVNTAEGAVISAQAAYNLADSTLARYRSLHDIHAISDLAMDQTQSQYEVASAQLQQAQAALSRAQNNLDFTTLRANRDGVIGSTSYEVGQVVSAGMPVALMVDDSQKEVHISLTEKQYGEYSVGMPCTVTFWALPHVQVKGIIKEKAASPTAGIGTYDVKVSLEDCPTNVTIGMTAQVSIENKMNTNRIEVPLTAMAGQKEQPSVWIVKDGKVYLVAVKVGKYGENSIEIIEGLKQGDRIVIAGTNKLSDGEEVRI